MGIVTTYVCDVSGKQGPREDFFEVTIRAHPQGKSYYDATCITKLVHKEVAEKLKITKVKEVHPTPEPTFESKLITLLKDWHTQIVDEAIEGATENVRNHG